LNFSPFRFDPYPAKAAFHDLPAYGQAAPGVRALVPGAQPLEYDEYPLRELRVDACGVVPDGETPIIPSCELVIYP
jgi:hypothetical protein